MDSLGRPTTEEEITIWQRVSLAVRRLEKSTIIDPTGVANDVFERLPQNLRNIAAILMLRQVARDILRTLHKPNGKKPPKRASKDEPTFSGDDFTLLNVRYPKAHKKGESFGYTPLDDMNEDDWNWNLDQLFAEGSKKTNHAWQLQRWGEKMKGYKKRYATASVS